MLAYAAGDTQHLVALRDVMKARLEAAGRLEWAEEEFAQLTRVRWAPDEDREPAFLRVKGAKALPRRQLAVFRELHRWRKELAGHLDRAEFRIIGNEALLAIAEQAPASAEALARIRGIGRDILERRGRDLLAAVRRGLDLPEAGLPRVERPPRREREPEVEARLARLKEARTAIAERLGLAAGVACPNSILELIARKVPASLPELSEIPGLRRWQVAAFGEELLAALRTP
jgi:ribonuclease D